MHPPRCQPTRSLAAVTSIRDVAQRAGVAPATVSRVLNGHAYVKPETAARVHAAVDELGYRRNASARALRRQVTDLWSVIVSDLENPFFTALVRGAAGVARTRGFSTILCNTGDDPVEEERYIGVALQEQAAGVIITPGSDATDLGPLLEAGIPVVTVDRRLGSAEVDTVTVDNQLGTAQAAELLLEFGVRRPGCITGPRSVMTATGRLAGFRKALATHGVVLPRALIRHADYRVAGGRAAAASLLEADEPPDGLFVTNNMMTMGALEALDNAGLRLPDDFVLVGFDEVPWATLLRPQLATVVQPSEEMGRQAGLLLADRIAGVGGPARDVVLRTEVRRPS